MLDRIREVYSERFGCSPESIYFLYGYDDYWGSYFNVRSSSNMMSDEFPSFESFLESFENSFD